MILALNSTNLLTNT